MLCASDVKGLVARIFAGHGAERPRNVAVVSSLCIGLWESNQAPKSKNLVVTAIYAES